MWLKQDLLTSEPTCSHRLQGLDNFHYRSSSCPYSFSLPGSLCWISKHHETFPTTLDSRVPQQMPLLTSQILRCCHPNVTTACSCIILARLPALEGHSVSQLSRHQLSKFVRSALPDIQPRVVGLSPCFVTPFCAVACKIFSHLWCKFEQR